MDSWLSQGIRGFAAMGKYLFVPTNEGLKRIELGSYGQFSIREFEQTKGVVFAGNQLQIGTKGIYIITSNEIKLIQIV